MDKHRGEKATAQKTKVGISFLNSTMQQLDSFAQQYCNGCALSTGRTGLHACARARLGKCARGPT